MFIKTEIKMCLINEWKKMHLKIFKKPTLRLWDVISDIVKLSKVKAATQFFLFEWQN